jgi:hypothetical protein
MLDVAGERSIQSETRKSSSRPFRAPVLDSVRPDDLHRNWVRPSGSERVGLLGWDLGAEVISLDAQGAREPVGEAELPLIVGVGRAEGLKMPAPALRLELYQQSGRCVALLAQMTLHDECLPVVEAPARLAQLDRSPHLQVDARSYGATGDPVDKEQRA